MVAYIDEFKDRSRVGPIRRVLAASLDCGLVTPRGYRMSRSGPVSRMAARHEAPARDILEIHADFFMAVYGYRKTHAQLLARGWDPAEIGRGQVMNVMWIGNGVLDRFLEDESLFGEFLRTPVSEGGVEPLVVEPPHVVVEVGA